MNPASPYLLCIALCLGFACILAQQAQATTEYANLYRTRCKTCHINNSGELNDTGKQYRKKKPENNAPAVATKKLKPQREAPADEKKTAITPLIDPPAKTAISGEERRENSSTKQAEPVAEAAQEQVIYRLTDADDTKVFTDNPYRLLKKQENQKMGTPADKTPKTVKRTPKALPAKNQSATIKQAPRKSGVAALPTKPKHQTYAECMESFLTTRPSPNGSQEMMGLFEEAELGCSAYEKTKR